MNSVAWQGKPVYPSKVVCIGRNYAEHIREFDNEPDQEPVIFLKPNSAIASEVYASQSELIHYEGEITFLIRSGDLGGIGFGLDLDRADLQHQLKHKGWPWNSPRRSIAAGIQRIRRFDGDVSALRMEFHINDVLVQHGNYDLMLSNRRRCWPMQSFLTWKTATC